MEATASKPTVLAKLLGFYTVEVRNLENGNTQAKADLLVMENLFYDRKVTKTFDLKGIQGRKIKASSGSQSKTLFDGEWIEGRSIGPCLVPRLLTTNARATTSVDAHTASFQSRPARGHQGRL